MYCLHCIIYIWLSCDYYSKSPTGGAGAEMHSWYISERKESIGKTHAKSTTRAEDHMVVTDQNHQPIYDGNHKREKRVSISYEHWLTLVGCVVPFFLRIEPWTMFVEMWCGATAYTRVSGRVYMLLVSFVWDERVDRCQAGGRQKDGWHCDRPLPTFTDSVNDAILLSLAS